MKSLSKTPTRLNTRITSATQIIDNHVSPSSLFALLEEYTLQTVSFNSFNFSDTKEGQILVNGSGEARGFESIVLQSDAFGKSEYMRNVIFTNLEPNIERGTIEFSFSATLNPKLILYRNSLPASFNSERKLI